MVGSILERHKPGGRLNDRGQLEMPNIEGLKLVRSGREVHPMADLFPMLSDEELEVLAEDIRENGQQVPCVLDSKGRLLDGRNRLKACEIAGVEPRFETYDGDPAAYVISANVNRRHLSAGQRAMAKALIEPEAKRGGARTKGASSETLLEFSKMRLSQARKVLRFNRDLAQKVMLGAVSLDEALKQAQAAETQANSIDGKWEKLRKEALDLSELVSEERLTLEEALRALGERERHKRDALQSAVEAVTRLCNLPSDITTIAIGVRYGKMDLLDDERTVQAVRDGYEAFERLLEEVGHIRQTEEEDSEKQ